MARAALLPAQVEIELSAGDVATARTAAEELVGIAGALTAPLLEAAAEQACGVVLLAEGDAQAALPALRRGWTRWWELQAPYETARVRLLIGAACQQLGDTGGAKLEWDSARKVFDQLGAAPDLARLDALSAPPSVAPAGGLSAREVEVLALVAAGKTNRQIAADLVISEHTVRRHLQNMFTKLASPPERRRPPTPTSTTSSERDATRTAGTGAALVGMHHAGCRTCWYEQAMLPARCPP